MAKFKNDQKSTSKEPKVKETISRQINIPFETNCDVKDICNRRQDDTTTEDFMILSIMRGVVIERLLTKKGITFDELLARAK